MTESLLHTVQLDTPLAPLNIIKTVSPKESRSILTSHPKTDVVTEGQLPVNMQIVSEDVPAKDLHPYHRNNQIFTLSPLGSLKPPQKKANGHWVVVNGDWATVIAELHKQPQKLRLAALRRQATLEVNTELGEAMDKLSSLSHERFIKEMPWKKVIFPITRDLASLPMKLRKVKATIDILKKPTASVTSTKLRQINTAGEAAKTAVQIGQHIPAIAAKLMQVALPSTSKYLGKFHAKKAGSSPLRDLLLAAELRGIPQVMHKDGKVDGGQLLIDMLLTAMPDATCRTDFMRAITSNADTFKTVIITNIKELFETAAEKSGEISDETIANLKKALKTTKETASQSKLKLAKHLISETPEADILKANQGNVEDFFESP